MTFGLKDETGLRIAQLVNAHPIDQMGGLQRYVGDLADELARRGHDLTVITKRLTPDLPSAETLANGVRLVRVQTPARSARGFAFRFPVEVTAGTARAVRAADFDIVHAHFAFQALGCRLSANRYMYTFHAPSWAEVIEDRGSRYRWPKALDHVGQAAYRSMEQYAVRGASSHVVLSRFMQSELQDLIGTSADPQLIPGGVDTKKFAPGLPTSLGTDPWFDSPGPVLFCARRLVPRMGVGNLIQSMSQILIEFPNARLAIAGDGFLRDQLEALIRDAHMTDHVRMLGRVSDGSLRDWYRLADLCVVPSSHLEGFGLTTVEALACGTPVVGTPAGATPELLQQLEPALVTADTSPDAIAETVRTTLRDRDRLTKLGERGRELAVRHWSWEVVGDEHVSRYQSQRHGALSR